MSQDNAKSIEEQVMPVKYKFVKIYHRKDQAQARKKKLEKAGYKVRLLVEELRNGSFQYVIYKNRGGKG